MKHAVLIGAICLLGACDDTLPMGEADAAVAADAQLVPDAQAVPDAASPDVALAPAMCRPRGKGVLLGDSIAYGAYVNSPAIFATSPDAVTNLAYPGHTTEQQHAAWLASPLAGDPEVRWIIVQVGINDLRRGRTDVQLVADWRALRQALAESNPDATVIWALMTPAHGNQDFQGLAYPRWIVANAALASEFAARLEASQAMNDGMDNLRPEYSGVDGLHPNIPGNRLNATWMMQWVAEETLPICL